MKQVTTFLLILGGIAALIAAIVLPSRSGHPVTPYMQEAADLVVGRTVPEQTVSGRIAAERSTVERTDLPDSDALDVRPQIIIFILPDCPCSEDYEPFTHELFRAYGSHVDFLGIVAGTDAEAQAWQQKHQTPFPVLADPNGDVALKYDAKRSAYTALVVDRTVIQRLWPGYSREMLQEVGSLAAAAVHIPPVSMDITGAPAKLTSGCYIGP